MGKPRPRTSCVLPAYPRALGLVAIAFCSCRQTEVIYDEVSAYLFPPPLGGVGEPYRPAPTSTPYPSGNGSYTRETTIEPQDAPPVVEPRSKPKKPARPKELPSTTR
ncbi:MAG: hypothetical protein HY898_12420 [Deltaproteobacteria bacterium]|nr:hypothetical protein [Deltaproteobacteria bacterium]